MLEAGVDLLTISKSLGEDATIEPTEQQEPTDAEPKCPACDTSLVLIHYERRPSWRVIFGQEIYRHAIYSPQHHLGTARAPPRSASER